MKLRSLLLTLLISNSFIPGNGQSFSLDMGTASNYIAHGRTLSNNLPCFQPSAAYSLKTGTNFTAWFSFPYDRNTSFNDEWNIIVDQSVQVFEDHVNWNVNLHGYANYWLNPTSSNPIVEPNYYNGMKYNIGTSKAIELHSGSKVNMTVGYDYYYYQTFGTGADLLRNAGIHEFLVNFNKKFKNFKIDTKSVISNNRGAINPNIIPGWGFFSQHLSFLVNTKKVSLRTSLNYQWTLEKTLHSENLLWLTVNLSRGFKI